MQKSRLEAGSFDAQRNDSHPIHCKLTAPSYNRSINTMKGSAFIKVQDGNNSNSVFFVGNLVHLRTSLRELITPRVI